MWVFCNHTYNRVVRSGSLNSLSPLSLVCWMDVLCVQVLTTLVGNLLAVKSRVGTTEGMLPIAEMALPLFLKCPGLLRYRREKI